jgi:hypothetical protein
MRNCQDKENRTTTAKKEGEKQSDAKTYKRNRLLGILLYHDADRIAVGADNFLPLGMNHQIHPFKRVRAEQNFIFTGKNHGLADGFAIFPADPTNSVV